MNNNKVRNLKNLLNKVSVKNIKEFAGATLDSVFPGVRTVVGAVVGFSAGLLITYKVDIEKNDRGRTIRDEVKDDILDKINSYGGAVKLWN